MDRKAIDRFRRLGEWLDEDERELIAEAMRLTPGERMLRGLQLSQAHLGDYARLLENPGFAAAEEASATRKADLHGLWPGRVHARSTASLPAGTATASSRSVVARGCVWTC